MTIRQRKEGRRGPKSLVKQECFNHGGVCVYIVIQGSLRQKNKVEQKHQNQMHNNSNQGNNNPHGAITTVTRGITINTGPEDNLCIGNRNMTK